jgi:hypothetical protein
MKLSNKELHVNNTINLVSDKLSDKYAPIDTQLFLQPFLSRGWTVENLTTNRKGTEVWYTLENSAFRIGDDAIRIELLNSYNGKSALKIAAGIGRLVCSNGMVVGTDFEQFRYVHRGNKIYENLENTYEQLVAHLNNLKAKIERLNNIYLAPNKVYSIIDNIYARTFETDGVKKKVKLRPLTEKAYIDALQVHREEDNKLDAYTVMNVIQENLVRYGAFNCETETTDKNTGVITLTKRTKRPSEGKIASHRLNSLITEQFLKAVA